MKHLGWSFDRALSVDNGNENRDIRCASARQVGCESFCFVFEQKKKGL